MRCICCIHRGSYRHSGQPYFNACPRTKDVFLPADADGKVHVDAVVARDWYGHRLPMVSNAALDNGQIILEWRHGSRQTVILQAADNWRQRTVCQFDVVIIGEGSNFDCLLLLHRHYAICRTSL